jgi:hypothetical protein
MICVIRYYLRKHEGKTEENKCIFLYMKQNKTPDNSYKLIFLFLTGSSGLAVTQDTEGTSYRLLAPFEF